MARLLTALVVIILCATAATRGVDVVRFSLARAGAATPQARIEAVQPWVAAPGLAGEALAVSLATASPADPDAARQRAEALGALLAVRPLASSSWLSLAGARLVARAPYDTVLGALTMSALTGANEGALMYRRGTFELVQWEVLPADLRRRAITDVAVPTVAAIVTDAEAGVAKAVLAAKSQDTRQEIGGLLRAEGVPMKDLARIGL